VSPVPETTSAAAHKVFICYRREETAAHAGRLYDAMVARFGEGNVFMDVDLAPGVDFVTRIAEVVAACKVLIVVMGPNWATVADEDGEVRIADPEDFVRLEVETGLRRPEVTPIPVLVSGARMPRREDLPPEVQAITRRNALDLSDGRWSYDVGRLNSTLDGLVGKTEVAGEIVARQPRAPRAGKPKALEVRRPSSARLILEGVLVAAAAAFAARWLGNGLLTAEAGDTAKEIASVVAKRGETWAFASAAVAVWLAARTGRADVVRCGLIGLLVGALAGAIGALAWGLPVIIPADEVSEAVANRIEIGSLAITGGLIGAMIGSLWRPPRLGAGLAGGVAAAVLTQLLLNGSGWNINSKNEFALSFGLGAATITAGALAALLALDRRQGPRGPSNRAHVAEDDSLARAQR
jgi:hypothetical protein